MTTFLLLMQVGVSVAIVILAQAQVRKSHKVQERLLDVIAGLEAHNQQLMSERSLREEFLERHRDALQARLDTLASPIEVFDTLRRVVELAGSQKAAADYFGVSPQYLSDILNVKREIPARVAVALGFRRSDDYVRLVGGLTRLDQTCSELTAKRNERGKERRA